MDIDDFSPAGSSAMAEITSSSNPHVGKRLELVEDEDFEQLEPVVPFSSTAPTHRCPPRIRTPPSRYKDFIPHS